MSTWKCGNGTNKGVCERIEEEEEEEEEEDDDDDEIEEEV